jgi:predicted nucleotidyltransferase
MQDLNVSLLPDLPQKHFLLHLLADLWQDPAVVCLWLTGSLARGTADIYSDVDLGVAVQPAASHPDRLPASAQLLKDNTVAHKMTNVGEHATLHYLLLAHSELYDLMVQTTEHTIRKQPRLVLACWDEAFGAQLSGDEELSIQNQAADPEVIRESIIAFWMAQFRQQKVLYRDLGLVAWMEEQLMRQELIRLWYALATGCDCGSLRQMTIHTLSPVAHAVRDAQGDNALALIGQSLRTRREILDATVQIRDEVARIGRQLAERLGFDYPSDVEMVVLRGWQQFPITPEHLA